MTADTTVELPKPRMPEDQPSPAAGRASVPLRPSLYVRPVQVGRTTVSTVARRLIGIREEVLAWVPEERARYTRLGLIVVNTGVMAAVSLFTALTRVVEVPWPVVIPIALFWGLLVLTIDSWMVSSTHGSIGPGRWLMFIPRLVMAVLLGCVIAEPLVLWIFHPAIDADVEHYRQELVRIETGLWTRCNPVDGADTTGIRDCRDHQLGLKGPAADQVTLSSLRDQRKTQNDEYVQLAAQRDEKQSLAEKECAGVKDVHTSGDEGWGPRCRAAWQVANEFVAHADFPGRQAKISSLDQQIKDLTTKLGGTQVTYGQAVQKGIDEKVTAYEKSFGRIDILEEAKGLERLSDQSFFVFAAKWLLRALLILVDSLPVLAKILGGTAYYDRLVNRQLRTGQSFHNLGLDYATHAEEASTASDMNKIDERSRQDREQHDEELDAEIDRRAQRYASEMA
jgi:hypothetical protein